jgi:hypothetical protein
VSKELVAELVLAEKKLIELYRKINDSTPNTLRAQWELRQAQEDFESGFTHLMRVVTGPDSPWPARH